MRELKNCPFCNGEASLGSGERSKKPAILVECLDCAAMTDIYLQEDSGESKATEAWNKRAHSIKNLGKVIFAHGHLLGQLSNLLNQVGAKNLTVEQIYKELLDITKSGALQANVLYYKGNKPA